MPLIVHLLVHLLQQCHGARLFQRTQRCDSTIFRNRWNTRCSRCTVRLTRWTCKILFHFDIKLHQIPVVVMRKRFPDLTLRSLYHWRQTKSVSIISTPLHVHHAVSTQWIRMKIPGGSNVRLHNIRDFIQNLICKVAKISQTVVFYPGLCVPSRHEFMQQCIHQFRGQVHGRGETTQPTMEPFQRTSSPVAQIFFNICPQTAHIFIHGDTFWVTHTPLRNVPKRRNMAFHRLANKERICRQYLYVSFLKKSVHSVNPRGKLRCWWYLTPYMLLKILLPNPVYLSVRETLCVLDGFF